MSQAVLTMPTRAIYNTKIPGKEANNLPPIIIMATDSSHALPVSGRTGIRRWTTIDCCHVATLHRDQPCRTSAMEVVSWIIRIGLINRIWIHREIITWEICPEAKTSWSKTQAVNSLWTHKCLPISKSRSKWRARTIRCCIPIRVILRSSALAVRTSPISFPEDRRWPDLEA